ncbi:hypothetical protein TURU_036103 [Turdus rufiventris]|nr:hypothetical protein TURU_036103 [Turdus rufiventris]
MVCCETAGPYGIMETTVTLCAPMEPRIHVAVSDPMEPKFECVIMGLHGILDTIMTLEGLVQFKSSAGPCGTKENPVTLRGLMGARDHFDTMKPHGNKGPVWHSGPHGTKDPI